MARPARYSPEVRERAVRMVPRHDCALESDRCRGTIRDRNRLPADVTGIHVSVTGMVSGHGAEIAFPEKTLHMEETECPVPKYYTHEVDGRKHPH